MSYQQYLLQPTPLGASAHSLPPRAHRLKALPQALATAAGLSLGMVCMAPNAATIVVNDGGDTSSASKCTLRDAISTMQSAALSPASNNCANTGGVFGTNDTIRFSNTFSEVTLTGSMLSVGLPSPLLIQGTGQGGITIKRTSQSNGLLEQYGGDLTLDGLTLTGGGGFAGGAITVYADTRNATLRVKNSVVKSNTVQSGGGGAIYARSNSNLIATVSITDSTVSNNSSLVGFPSKPSGGNIGPRFAFGGGDGGGIYVDGPSVLNVSGSTLLQNYASGSGGGIFVGREATATVVNSTLSNNVSFCEGAAVYGDAGSSAPKASVTLRSSTITQNRTNGECPNGGGFYQYGGTLTLNNTIVAGNFNGAASSDIAAAQYGGGLSIPGANNLVQNVSSAVTFTNARLTSNPLLGPLANNGGPTLTHALLTGSPAINAGGSTTLPTDQRGVGFQRVVGIVDIGAFETPINGACGSASSSTPVLATPTTNLCSTGTATLVTGPQPYAWGCNGIGGGSTSTSPSACTVPLQSWTVLPLVATGSTSGSISPNTVQSVLQNAATSFTLTPMSGYSAGTATGCNGTLLGAVYTTGPVIGNCNVIASFTLTPINGVCGSASSATPALSAPTANLCSTGTLTNFVGGTTGPWTWGCAGNATGISTAANACAVAARAGLTLLGNSVVIPGGAPTPLLINGTDFASVTVGQNTSRSFVINNNGSLPLTINSLSFVGVHASNFVVTSPTLFPVVVAAGQNLNFTVRFTPSAAGLRSATLSISADDGVSSGGVGSASSQRLKALLATGFAVQGVGVAAVESIPVPAVGLVGLLAGLLGVTGVGITALRRKGGKRDV